MARILIVGGEGRAVDLVGSEGRAVDLARGEGRAVLLARGLLARGHAVRVVAEDAERCREVEAAGAEAFVGTPERLATLRGALEHVTVACWLLATPRDAPGCDAAELHGSRLRQFLASAVDTTLRGFVYEVGASELEPAVGQAGERIVAEMAARNAIPTVTLRTDPRKAQAWLDEALEGIGGLLGAG